MDRLYVRQANIVFSKDFVDRVKEHSVIITRRNHFNRNGVIINHGNGKPITIGKKAKDIYIINKPEAISKCSNKNVNCKILKDYYPKLYDSIDSIDNYPVIVKPINGHHGYGIEVFDNEEDISNFFDTHSIGKYIIQQYIDIKHEYRFNIIDKEVYQTSHKMRQEGETDGGGFIFTYRSLGKDAKISQKFWDYVDNIINDFHEEVGSDLGHYCIDVMKGFDKKYYLTEINSACGLGDFTLGKLIEELDIKYSNGDLDKYKVE